MKEIKNDDIDYKVRRENLSEWIKKFEDHFMKNAELDEDVKEYIEFSMEHCAKARNNFYENYLTNLDDNLNVLSDKNNYQYHDFYRKINPYIPLEKNLFKKSSDNN